MTANAVDTVGQLQYQQRIVAFVDFLGFDALVKRSDGDAAIRDKIFGALRDFRAFMAPTVVDTDYRAQNFSDSLIISAANTADGLWHVLFSLSDLAINLQEIEIGSAHV